MEMPLIVRKVLKSVRKGRDNIKVSHMLGNCKQFRKSLKYIRHGLKYIREEEFQSGRKSLKMSERVSNKSPNVSTMSGRVSNKLLRISKTKEESQIFRKDLKHIRKILQVRRVPNMTRCAQSGLEVSEVV